MFSSVACSAESGVGDELSPLAIGLGQLRAHQVEGLCELGDLVAPADRHPLAVLAPRHRRRGAGHLAQRRRHPAGEELHDDECEQDRQRDADAPVQADVVREHRRRNRDDDRGDDHDPELQLQRPDPGQRAHSRGSSSNP
jgi:hypothetical protein